MIINSVDISTTGYENYVRKQAKNDAKFQHKLRSNSSYQEEILEIS